MPKEAYINVRVDKRLKARAEKVLSRVGITTTDAVTMLLHQVVLRKGLPFEARIPNKETRAAIAEIERVGGEKLDGSVDFRDQRTADRVDGSVRILEAQPQGPCRLLLLGDGSFGR